jgi:hypothetical protein
MAVTTRYFAVLLAQQNISARISNHPYHKRRVFGECTGVWSVCIGVLFHYDGYTASNQISFHMAETDMLHSFGIQSPISKRHWYESSSPRTFQFLTAEFTINQRASREDSRETGNCVPEGGEHCSAGCASAPNACHEALLHWISCLPSDVDRSVAPVKNGRLSRHPSSGTSTGFRDSIPLLCQRQYTP